MNKKVWKNLLLPVLFLAVIGMTACTGSRKAVREPIKEQGDAFLVEKLKENELPFSQFSAKFNASYTVDQKTTNVTGNLRIERDSIIWISITPALGIEAVRFLLTPDSIKYMNRIDNTYLIEGFTYINELLNKTLDYDMAQSFLLGNDFSLYESNTFKASVEGQEYKLSTTNRQKIRRSVRKSEQEISIPIQSIWLNPETYKISKVLLKEAERDNRRFLATYGEFENRDGRLIPTSLDFKVETTDNKIRIMIGYSKIQIDQQQSYPFRIPDNYTQIQGLNTEKK